MAKIVYEPLIVPSNSDRHTPPTPNGNLEGNDVRYCRKIQSAEQTSRKSISFKEADTASLPGQLTYYYSHAQKPSDHHSQTCHSPTLPLPSSGSSATKETKITAAVHENTESGGTKFTNAFQIRQTPVLSSPTTTQAIKITGDVHVNEPGTNEENNITPPHTVAEKSSWEQSRSCNAKTPSALALNEPSETALELESSCVDHCSVQEVSQSSHTSFSGCVSEYLRLESSVAQSTTSISGHSSMDMKESNEHSYLGKVWHIFLCILCFIVLYPLLLLLLPLLVSFKLLAAVACCIPCRKLSRTTLRSTASFPFLFGRRRRGQHCVLVIFPKEQISFSGLHRYLVASLKQAYHQKDTRSFVLKLASTVERKGCFSWWKVEQRLDILDHVHLVHKDLTTTKDLSNFAVEISNAECNNKSLWSVFLIPNYNDRSAILVRIHHSLAMSSPLKTAVIQIFSQSLHAPEKEIVPKMEDSSPFSLKAFFQGPYVCLKYFTIAPLYNSLHPLVLSGKKRRMFSEMIDLNPAKNFATKLCTSLDAVFMTCLTGVLRSHLLHNKEFLWEVPFAVAISSTSLFIVKLPVSEENPRQQLQKVTRQLKFKREDAGILLWGSKVVSTVVSARAAGALAGSVLKQATGIFSLVNCPNHFLYLDMLKVSSVASWVPLFDTTGLGFTVVCYRNTFRICVESDNAISDWPEVFIELFIIAYSKLLQT